MIIFDIISFVNEPFAHPFNASQSDRVVGMSKEVLHQGAYRRFVKTSGWEYMERIRSSEVVVLIPVTEDRKVIFVEQFRVPVQRNMIEFPAGLVNDLDSNQHESLEETARRELIEETGYEAATLKKITRVPANSALATDMLTVYFASGLRKVGAGGGDETENITVHEVPLSEVDQWLRQQEARHIYIDPKVYAGLYYLERMEGSVE